MTRRAIRGVLTSFLNTYISRYSEYDGYWLFGFLVASLGELRIDLLAPSISDADSSLSAAIQSASVKFADQTNKAGLDPQQVREAWLAIRKLPGQCVGQINSVPCLGYNISFLAGAVMNGGRLYELEKVVFIAPHNAAVEHRTGRAAGLLPSQLHLAQSPSMQTNAPR